MQETKALGAQSRDQVLRLGFQEDLRLDPRGLGQGCTAQGTLDAPVAGEGQCLVWGDRLWDEGSWWA